MTIERLSLDEGVPVYDEASLDSILDRTLREHSRAIQILEPGEHPVGESDSTFDHLSVFGDGTGRLLSFSKQTGAIILCEYLPADLQRSLTIISGGSDTKPDLLYDIIRWRPGIALNSELTDRRTALQGTSYQSRRLSTST